MATHKLTVHKVATAVSGKCKECYGPRQVVSESGAKNWVMRHTLHGRRREMGFGNHPSAGLSDAGTSAVKCRRQVAKGVDPIEARRMEAKQIPAFTASAALSIRGDRHGWQHAKTLSNRSAHSRPMQGPSSAKSQSMLSHPRTSCRSSHRTGSPKLRRPSGSVESPSNVMACKV